MIQLIATIILLASLSGIAFILFKKAPALAKLPKNGSHGIPKAKIVSHVEEKVKNVYSLFEKQIILHKILSWIKIMTLKIEHRVDIILHKIRKKAQSVDNKIDKKK